MLVAWWRCRPGGVAPVPGPPGNPPYRVADTVKPIKDLLPVTDVGASTVQVKDWQEKIRAMPMFSGWSTGVLGGWTPDEVRGVLSAHAAGNFAGSGRLYGDVTANTTIRHCLDSRKQVWSMLPRHVTASGRGEGRRCADFMREVLHEVLPLNTLKVLHEHYMIMGFAVAAVDWEERTDGKDRWWLPVIKPWHPAHLTYRWDWRQRSADGGTFLATTMNHGQVAVQPGDGRWLVIQNGSLHPWMQGLIRAIGESWLGYNYNFYDNQSMQERYARGFLKLFFPVQWKDTEIRATVDALRDGGSGGVLPCPTLPDGGQKVDADLLRVAASAYGTFDATDSRLLRNFLIAILGQDMTTRGQTGGYAQAVVHAEVLWGKREEDARAFGDAANQADLRIDGDRRTTYQQWQPMTGPFRAQIWRWIAYFNFGDFSLAPYVWWDATPPEDYNKQEAESAEIGAKKASTLASLAGALEQIGSKVELTPEIIGSLMDQCGLDSTAIRGAKVATQSQPQEQPPREDPRSQQTNRNVLLERNFDEGKHPRGPDGKFGHGGLGSVTSKKKHHLPEKFSNGSDAAEYVTKRWPHLNANLGLMHGEAAHAAVRVLHDVDESFPHVVAKMKHFGISAMADEHSGVHWGAHMEACADEHGVYINPNSHQILNTSDARALIPLGTKKGKLAWTVESDDPNVHPLEATVRHEIAHSIDLHYEHVKRDMRIAAFKNQNNFGGISAYAKTDKTEGFAEAYTAMYVWPRTKWTPTMKKMETMIQGLKDNP